MALIGNYSVLNKSCGQFTNGSSVAGSYAAVTPSNYKNNGLNLNRYSTFDKFNATPSGYLPPYSFVLPITSGGLASHTQANASISETIASLAAGINIDAAITGEITLTNGQLDQIANLISAITGSISTTNASLAAVSALGAAITASGTITTAQLGALVNMVAAITGSINITNANDFATANISADMSVTTGTATPAQIATEVFDNQDVETGYTLRKSLRLILSALSGKLSGAGTSTVVIRNVTDTKDRISASVDSNGNRTSITTDVD